MNTAATTRAKKHWTGGEKFLLGAILALIILVAAGALWWHSASALPAVTIPTPNPPSPNAFDYFVAAGNAVVDGDKIKYAAASSGSPRTSKGLDRAYTLTEQTALVRKNAGVLKTLRRGLAYPYLSPPGRSINDKFPYWAQERDLARLLRLEGQVEAAHGDWGRAGGSGLDAVQMGEQIPHGAVLIGGLVGFACQSIGRRDLWSAANHLNARQTQADRRRLERIQSLRVPYAETLQQEEWMGQAAMLEQFRQGHLTSWHLTQSIVLSHYTRYMDQCIADARLPYAARPPAPPIPRDPVSAIFCPVFLGASLKDTDNQTQNVLLTTTLSLRAYRLEHRMYPATLSALVPDYLSRVPEDPFALSGPPRYKRQGATYLLYSVGPDGRDDGGKAIFDASKPAPTAGASSDPRRFVQADSKGDIVAGVNLF